MRTLLSKTTLFCFALLVTSSFYYFFDIFWEHFFSTTEIVFYLLKEPILRESTLFNLALSAHIGATFYILVVGLYLIFSGAFRWSLSVHKFLGMIYFALVTFLAAPGGLVLAFYSFGSVISSVTFFVFSLIWFFTAIFGYLAIKQRKLERHAHYMLANYSIALIAPMQRLCGYLAYQLFGVGLEGNLYDAVNLLSFAMAGVVFAFLKNAQKRIF